MQQSKLQVWGWASSRPSSVSDIPCLAELAPELPGALPPSPRDPQSICSSSMPGCSETFFPSVGKNPCTLILSWVTSVPFSSHSSLTLLFAMASPAPSPPCTPPAVHPVLACFLGTAHFLPLPTALTHSGSLLQGEQVQLSAPQPLRPSSILALPEAQAHISGSTSYTMSVCQGQ